MLQMTRFHSFLRLSNIPCHVYATPLSIHPPVDTGDVFLRKKESIRKHSRIVLTSATEDSLRAQ